MKLTDKISRLMGRVPKSLFPHLNECFDTPLTEQEQRLVSILEIVQVEKYASRGQINHWRGRNPLDRQSMARAFVAKTLYRLPTTIDLILVARHVEFIVNRPNYHTVEFFLTSVFILNSSFKYSDC